MRTTAAFLALTMAVAATLVDAQTSRPRTELSDGLPTATPESLGLKSKVLRDMEAAIRAGEFKKIGSVLLAKNGNLAYETYFEGDALTLRDTRSTTKTITGALVG